MKYLRNIAISTSTAIFALCQFGYALTIDPDASNVQIEFVDSNTFADIQYGKIDSEKGRAIVLGEIRKTFVKETSKHLPIGYKMTVTVNDIDLAGDREPYPPSFGDFRLLKAVYPPRIDFDYAIYDANEQLVASGNSILSDLAYQNNIRMSFELDEIAPWIKDLVRTWAKRDLKRMMKIE